MDGPSLKILMIVATLFTQCESMKSFLDFLLAKSQIQVLRAFFSIQIPCFTIYTECCLRPSTTHSLLPSSRLISNSLCRAMVSPSFHNQRHYSNLTYAGSGTFLVGTGYSYNSHEPVETRHWSRTMLPPSYLTQSLCRRLQ